jgi:surfactin synthase thioesterase subunit
VIGESRGNCVSGALLVPITPEASHPVSLVCIPHAGAGAGFFYPWRPLGEVASLWAVRFPGRENRISEPFLTSIDAMADALVPSVVQIPAQAMMLFGHCSGALVAYELAIRLARIHPQSVNLRLVISSQPAPFGRGDLASESVAQLSQPALFALLRKLGGTPEGVLESSRLMSLMEPIIRADLLAVEQYRPAAPEVLPYDITVLAAKSDQAISDSSLSAWRQCTSRSFEINWFDGQHFFVEHDEALIAYLAQSLRSMR